jgi:aspartate dehydrogenase
MNSKKRIGLIGFGQMGSFVYQEITAKPELGLEIAFVNEIDSEKRKDLPEGIVLNDMKKFHEKDVDLVVEVAHPQAVHTYGEKILSKVNMLAFSVTALADPVLEETLLHTAEKCGTTLFIPHGALLGLDGVIDGRDLWEEVTITMRKNPRNLNFKAAPQWDPDKITQETVLYDGPTRGVCSQFPKNVNTHATLALASIGFDKARSILVADPKLDESIIEVKASGAGVKISTIRSNPIKGVTGRLTMASVIDTVCRLESPKKGIYFC